MAVTITSLSDAPGRAAKRHFWSKLDRNDAIYRFTVTFDSSYPTGGEDISTTITGGSPWDVFGTVHNIIAVPVIAPGGTGGLTAGHLVWGVGDIANKKLILMDNNAQVADTTNASLIVVDCFAIGHG